MPVSQNVNGKFSELLLWSIFHWRGDINCFFFLSRFAGSLFLNALYVIFLQAFHTQTINAVTPIFLWPFNLHKIVHVEQARVKSCRKK